MRPKSERRARATMVGVSADRGRMSIAHVGGIRGVCVPTASEAKIGTMLLIILLGVWIASLVGVGGMAAWFFLSPSARARREERARQPRPLRVRDGPPTVPRRRAG
jgi:hypothetical protein